MKHSNAFLMTSVNKLLLPFLLFFAYAGNAQPKASHNLHFTQAPVQWDEALPIGNGWLGALVWQKDDRLRLSLDRADLWDDRPMPIIDQLRFSWVLDQVKKRQYDTVQAIGDRPYDQSAAPSKIPGAALEFATGSFGKMVAASLDISNGLASVEFANGSKCLNYVHASRMVGYFAFEKLPDDQLQPILIAPAYTVETTAAGNMVVDGQSLQKLGYAAGKIIKQQQEIRYRQPTWQGHYYEVLVRWKKMGKDGLIGAWTISVDSSAILPEIDMRKKEPTHWPEHLAWWRQFWSRSAVSLPDSLLEKQYYLELYKFGSVVRPNTAPISLQAIWTADNGKLPPWKGDLHHDLNTQLSYWPGYVSNHLDLTSSFTNWCWKVRGQNKKWTKQYFEADGLNVPGVTTISGKAMGGWIQYSMSPTVAAWLAQHFYQQWAYSMDRDFLREKCLPYLKEIDVFLSAISTKNADGILQLPLSSSPEINDNSVDAWFLNTTNFDLALIQNFYRRYADLMEAFTGKPASALRQKGSAYGQLDQDKDGLTVAPGFPLMQSHRHHSNLMAIYPLGLLSRYDADDKVLMEKSLTHMQSLGTKEWVGYSFAWAASLYASLGMADSAVRQLAIFASNFCSANSFHLNGDQRGGQYSGYTNRPFTLEGNFAFAQGIHELLLQSEKGFIEVFPATPAGWKHCSFKQLRAAGAVLVDAVKMDGVPQEIKLSAEKSGIVRVKLPFRTFIQEGIDRSAITFEENGIIRFQMKAKQVVVLKNGFE